MDVGGRAREREAAGDDLLEGMPFRDRSIRLVQRLTSRGEWRIPAEQFARIPAAIARYLDTLDPIADARCYDRAVRLLAMLHSQNLQRDKSEVHFLRGGPQLEQDEPELIDAPQQQLALAHIEKPGLRDAAETARILEDLGILQAVAQGSAEGQPKKDS